MRQRLMSALGGKADITSTWLRRRLNQLTNVQSTDAKRLDFMVDGAAMRLIRADQTV